MQMPQVAIVIVSYRGREDTLECLQSLRGLTYPRFSVIVVDQASADGAPAEIAARFPETVVVESAENDGFAGGNNRGATVALAAGAEYLFFLNNDTTVAPDLLDRLVEVAESDASIGIVGALMLYFDRPDVVWSAGGAINRRGESLMREQGRPASDIADVVFDVDFVVGCGLLIKRSVWERVGPMDDRFFLYYEEADLCARARAAGWRAVTAPAGRLWHKVSRSTGEGSALTLYYMRRNVLRYLERCAPHPLWARLDAMADLLRLMAVWQLRGNGERARVLRWALGDYLRGRMGRSDRF